MSTPKLELDPNIAATIRTREEYDAAIKTVHAYISQARMILEALIVIKDTLPREE